MKKIFAALLSAFIVSLAFAQSAHAIIIYLGAGEYRQIVYANVTGDKVSGGGKFTVKNLNNFTIEVQFEPQGNLADAIEIPFSVRIAPNETKETYFKVVTKTPGNYTGKVQISYLPVGVNEQAALLEATVRVVVQEVTPETNYLMFAGIGVAVVGGAVALIFRKISAKKFPRKRR
jgi:hypothetical protein